MASETTMNSKNSEALGPKRLGQLQIQASERKTVVGRLLHRLRCQRFGRRRSRKADCGSSFAAGLYGDTRIAY